MILVHQDFQGRHYYAHFGGDPDARETHRDALTAEEWKLAEQFADEWDQKAFDPDYDTLPLEHFEPKVRQVFASAQIVPAASTLTTDVSEHPASACGREPLTDALVAGDRLRCWASSKRSWSSAWRRSVRAPTALRGTRPFSVGAGAGIGSPMTSTSFERCRNLAPFGIMASLPPMPTGTIGTRVLAAT